MKVASGQPINYVCLHEHIIRYDQTDRLPLAWHVILLASPRRVLSVCPSNIRLICLSVEHPLTIPPPCVCLSNIR